MTLLRFLTMGSVDDGKSTLIGRLLHDTHAIYQDQFASVRAASAAAGGRDIDFSLVTDGLRAEREQGITIDVAYRHFSTPRRRFIIADTPGHEQYTRNMATGASTASLAVLLIDARKGVLVQTHRHAAIAWLLGVRNFAVAVNKMDLVAFREDVFRKIERDFREFASRLGPIDLFFVPVCSLDGDNVVERSVRMPWFEGASLLEYLETAPVAAAGNPDALRFPVQNVIRSDDGSRRYAGQIASGRIRRGDRVWILPSGRESTVTSIRIGDREIECAAPPQSVTIAMEDEIDLGRGDMMVDPDHPPATSRRMPATLLWMGREPMKLGHPYLIKHTSRQVCASVTGLAGVIDPRTLERRAAHTLELNEFGDVEIETHHPLYADPYAENRVTGAFIVIDPITNGTVGAGMIGAMDANREIAPKTEHGVTVWFTGLSSAGKSTISKAVYEKLWARGYKVELLDGDIVRQQFSKGLGFSREDRDENIRRIGFAAELLSRNGVIVLVSAISPYRAVRDEMRAYIGSFLEVYVHAPLEVCEQRDQKGIYRRVRAGEIHGVSGVDDPYEAPLTPEIECRTDRETLAESVGKVLEAVEGWLAHSGKSRQ
ncbi:MAG TPA: adenylyl-sulfate kinase [Bryobacteraceae bacterium]|nr:adenylyl-sulfate kinase [Bryobacteraceae bacterium]